MAYVVARPNQRWELRESRATAKGPRSRTLASFHTLTPDLIARARSRAGSELTDEAIRRAALRAGAPIASSPSDAAAASLLREVTEGRDPNPVLRRVLVDALGPEEPPSDAERAAVPWIGATAEERGEALIDLLLLTDQLPVRARPSELRYPRVGSSTR